MTKKPGIIDFFEFMRSSIHTNQVEVDECLLLNYRCWESGSDKVWFKESHFVFILSGEKKWEFNGETFQASPGEIVFVKQGSGTVHHSNSSEFCALILFMPHQYVSNFIVDNNIVLKETERHSEAPLVKLDHSIFLDGYRNSILSCLADQQIDTKPLAQVKFQELLHYIFGQDKLREISRYLVASVKNEQRHLKHIMQENFMYPLRLEDYADMSNMSLSTFKRKFVEIYKESPGNWLLSQRIELSKKLLTSTTMSVGEIARKCGFNSSSYYVKAFRKTTTVTPLKYRSDHSAGQ